jgi:hypothetical protein
MRKNSPAANHCIQSAYLFPRSARRFRADLFGLKTRIPPVVTAQKDVAIRASGVYYSPNRGFLNMVEPAGQGEKSTGAVTDRAITDYVNALSEESRMLVALKAQLYAGSWEPMRDDLRNRLDGKPYIFKLVNRIQDDIERIEQMMEFEAEHNIDLTEYVRIQ